MTLLVNQQFAPDTLEPLSSQTPDTIPTVGAISLPVEPLGLEDVTVHLVHLPPPPGSSPVDAPVLTMTQLTRSRGQTREHVHCELSLLVNLVQSDGLVQLHLALDDAGVSLLVHPLHCQILEQYYLC